MKKYTITFEDHGQDFLEWDVDADGNVIDCRPFQYSIWSQYKVINLAELAIGEQVHIKLKTARPKNKGTWIKYHIENLQIHN